MKKAYIIPNEKVCKVQVEDLMALSTQQNAPAITNYESEGGGDGNNDVKGQNLWNNEW